MFSRFYILFTASCLFYLFSFTISGLNKSIDDSTILLSRSRIALAEAINTNYQTCEDLEENLVENLVHSDEILDTLMQHTIRAGLDGIALKTNDLLKKEFAHNIFLKKAAQIIQLELVFIVFFKESKSGHFLLEIYGPGIRNRKIAARFETNKSFLYELEDLSKTHNTNLDEFIASSNQAGELIIQKIAARINAKNCIFTLFGQELASNDKALLIKFSLNKLLELRKNTSSTYTFATAP